MSSTGMLTCAKQISIVVPIYNEALNIQPFLDRTIPILNHLNLTYELIFCLDPSQDFSENIIRHAIENNPNIHLLIFSRRFGQPAATMAGILYCQGEACVVIDVDLQDPPELISPLYQKLNEGFEVVFAKRKARRGETLIKRLISHIGYKIIHRLSDIEIPTNTGDFRIMTRRVIEELRKLNETHGFLRGLVSYVGFKQTSIEYIRDERLKGKGHYNRFTGSLKIGLNGLISFSYRPLQIISIIGAFIFISSLILSVCYCLNLFLPQHFQLTLSPSIILIGLLSGIQFLSLGIMGEYIGRIYEEVKRRPMFIIDKIVKHMPKDEPFKKSLYRETST